MRTLIYTLMLLSLALPCKGESFSFEYDLDLSEQQQNQLDEISEKFQSRIIDLRKSTRSTKSEADELNALYEAEQWTVLTDEQRGQIVETRAKHAKDKAKLDNQHLLNIAPVVMFVAQAKSIVVYEGAPRRRSGDVEKLSDVEAISIEKFQFYREPLRLSPEAAQQLSSFMSDYHSFDTYGGGKMCGGFHPDAVVSFSEGDRSYKIMLCFGCAEARISDGTTSFYTELTESAYDPLLAVLKPYLAHRASGD